jgi:hypothetical protein
MFLIAEKMENGWSERVDVCNIARERRTLHELHVRSSNKECAAE